MRSLVWVFVVTLVVILSPEAAKAALPPHYFTDFESGGGWSEEPLPPEKSPLRLVQGNAAIVALAEENSSQALELGPSNPFTAVFVDTLPLAKSQVAFCEILARPAAVNDDLDAEFFDFGGSVLGFFRVGDKGELRVLSSRSPDESVWISTGMRFAVDDDGTAADWLQIMVRLDRRTERWDLIINGTPALSGLRAVHGKAAGLALWLYGQKTQVCRFDNLLLSVVEPDHLEKMLAVRRARVDTQRSRINAPGPKTVKQSKLTATLRNAQPVIQKAERQLITPVLRGLEAVLQIGNQTYNTAEVTIEGRKTSLAIYSTSYDDNGNPLPGVFTITADAELKPGTDLSSIRWIMAELKGGPDGLGEVLAAGDFSTGLVQTITIPGEWTKKATRASVWVSPGGLDSLWLHYKVQK